MLVHRTCKSQLYLNLNPAYKFIAAFGVGPKGLKTSLCEIIQVSTSGPSMFFCPICETDVTQSDVLVQCMQGGEFVELSNAVRSESAGGMYCQEHGVEYFDDCTRLNISKFTVTKVGGDR